MSQPPVPYLGEIAALAAALSWAISLALFKAWGEGISAVALNLMKNTIAVLGLLAGLLVLRPPFPADTGAFGWLAFSGVLGIAVSDTLLLAGMARVGTALTAASFCLTPPLSALLAWWFLGEALSPLEIAGITTAIGAVAGVAALQWRPPAHHAGTRVHETGLLLLLFAQVANTVGLVIGHGAFARVDVLHGTLIRILPAVGVLVPLGFVKPRGRARRRPDRKTIAVLTLSCVIGTLIGLVLMSLGLKYARAGVASALNATYPIWALPLSRVFLKEPLTGRMVALVLVAVAGTALLFLG